MNLFIIGNGFDLSHNLPTKYEDFQSYLLRTYPDSLKVTPSFDISSQIMPDGEEVYDTNELVAFLMEIISNAEKDGDKWSDLETSLGNLDFSDYFDELSYLYDENHKDFNEWHQAYRYEDVSGNFFKVTVKIKKLFSDWVNTIKLNTVKPIKSFEKLIDKSQDYFINFNYTEVLEQVYGTSKVWHLHGQQNKNDIIIGHGVFKETIETNYIGSEFALSEIHNELRKDTDQIIEKWGDLFWLLIEVNNVYSYGFSFSEVDLAYIKKICEVIDTREVTWYLNDFDDIDTRELYIRIVRNCGFKGSFSKFGIETIKYN